VQRVASYPQLPLPASGGAWVGEGVAGEKQWQDIRQYWLSPTLQPSSADGASAAAQVVQAWIGALNWDMTNGAVFALNGGPPKVLLQTPGMFEQDYLAAPLLSVS
jgi:hypothetical protein